MSSLKENYDNACNAYLKEFCEKHDFDYDEAANSWVAGYVGDACMIGDYSVSFEEIKTDIDMDATKDEYWSYYDYSLESHELGFNCPNYANWLRGCPRLSEEQRKSLREAKNREVGKCQKQILPTPDCNKQQTFTTLCIRGYGEP